jgi:PAS domain S-box-containing protein
MSNAELLAEIQALRARLAPLESADAERRRAEEELRRSESRFRALIENSSDSVLLLSPDGTILYEAPKKGRALGYVEEDFVGRNALEQVHPEDRETTRKALAAVRERPSEPQTFQLRALHKDGSWTWLEGIATNLLDEPSVRAIVVNFRSISQRKQAEEALRQTEERFRTQYHCLPIPTFTWRKTGDDFTLVDFNEAAEAFTGGAVQRLIGASAAALYANEPQFVQEMGRAFQERSPVHREGRYRFRSSGEEKDVSVTLVRVPPDLLMVHCEDITERKRDQERLRESAQRLQSLSRRLLEVQEQERRHLARELHDEIGQLLTGLKLALEAGSRLGGDGLRSDLTEARAMVRDLTARIRDLSLRLRPTMLDDLGLVPALVWHFQRYTSQTRVYVAFEHRGVERRFPPEVETAAYRIVQEALTNTARHAGVAEVTVRAWLDQDLIGVQVEDWGTGFDAQRVLTRGASSGLSGMHERAELLGGRLVVDSAPGHGTRVTAELPVGRRLEKIRNFTDGGEKGRVL